MTLGKLWRIPAQGFSFVLLGVGGILIALTHTLVILPMPIAKGRKQRIARSSIRIAFYCYVRTLRALGLLTFQFHNVERLMECEGQVIVANHPTLLDVVFLMSLVPNANCVVKAALWRVPLTAAPVRITGYIKNDDENILERCLESIKAGDNLIIFPEGTRSTPGEPLKFQRGFFYLAMSPEVPVRPVVIDCEPLTLLKGEPWYRVPDGIPRFQLWVDSLVTFPEEDVQLPRTRRVRRMSQYLKQYYEGRFKQLSLKL